MSPGFVHEVFYAVAALQPDRTAIEWNGRRFTYGELRAKAAAIASWLGRAGVTRGSRVILFAENALSTIEYMLGVLTCSAAFVPVSPALPPKRLSSMLTQSDAAAALVQPGLERQFAAIAGPPGIPIVEEHTHTESPPPYQTRHTESRSGGDDLSYLVFTSGSTGVPKAIAGRLKAIDHFVRWEIETFGIGVNSRVSQLFSPMFDAFLRDVFAPLCSGGAICIPPDRDTALDGRSLAAWLREERITHVHTVPSVLRMLLDHAQQVGGWPELQHILVAGEALTPSDVRRWFETPEARPNQLINLYGPSETTMTKFVYVVQPDDQARRSIPIGKPMPGAKAIVMDDAGRVCPPGVVGEIYIRTPFRSLGYFGQADMTREVFVQNPFTSNAEDIVYKTGDLARVLEDGNFELVGRRDHQVKIRGVRLELGEIEAALARHREVAQCAVVVRHARSAAQLVAYVVSRRPGAPLDTHDLRRSVRDWLPAVALPDLFIQLDSMPLTPNGKVDRNALPPVTAAAQDGVAAGARDGEEEVLCGIFADVLDKPAIGIHESFFENGGHSLLATQIVSRVRNAFQIDLPLRAVFDSPTVAELIGHIRLMRQSDAAFFEQIPRTAPGEELMLSYAQHRLWFLTQLDPQSAAYNLTFGLRLKGPLDQHALERALQHIMQRHDVLRTSFPAINGTPTARIHDKPATPIHRADLRRMPQPERDAEIQRLLDRAADTPFDPHCAPLFRVWVIQSGEREFLLSVTAHHIICDAWSTGIFVRELTDLYDSFVQGVASALPGLSIQYQDFAAWERASLSADALEAHVDYWRHRLSGCTHTLLLPTDFPRPAVQSFRGSTEVLALPAEVVVDLRQCGRKTSATEFMTLLAVMKIWLYSLAGQDDILVGTPISNRNRTETENLIGLFLNTLVLRNQIDPSRSFLEFLNQVRTHALEAYAHQAVPFDRLVDELHVPRDPGRNPLIQAMLNIEHLQPSELRLRDLEVHDIDIAFVRSRMDLHLGARPKPNGLELILIYNAGLFLPSTAKGMLSAFGELARMVAAAPQASIAQLVADLRRYYQNALVLQERDRTAVQLQSLYTAKRQGSAEVVVGSGR